MATVKGLTSTPGLEGSLLRCQGHIGRSDRQRLREGRKTRWRVGRRREKDMSEGGWGGSGRSVCIMCACARVCVFTCVHVRACEREFYPFSGFRYTGTHTRTGIPYRGNPYWCTRYYRRVPPALMPSLPTGHGGSDWKVAVRHYEEREVLLNM